MPPPGGAKVGAKDKPTTATKINTNENKDENGYPKPDFSGMEKYYEIIRYEYSTTDHALNIVAKMMKEVNPNDFEFKFYDADGAVMQSGSVVWSVGDSDRKPGDVESKKKRGRLLKTPLKSGNKM